MVGENGDSVRKSMNLVGKTKLGEKNMRKLIQKIRIGELENTLKLVEKNKNWFTKWIGKIGIRLEEM